MHSKLSSTPTRQYADGSYAAVVQHRLELGNGQLLLRVALPVATPTLPTTGQFFMARCAADNRLERELNWSIYGRRALFVAGQPAPLVETDGYGWDLLLPNTHDAGYAWLSRRALNSPINLLGPFGQPFPLAAQTNTLLVVTMGDYLPLLLPAIHMLLDRGGRVTLLLVAAEAGSTRETPGIPPSQSTASSPTTSPPMTSPPMTSDVMALLPIPVEVRVVSDEEQLRQELSNTLLWADQLVAALPFFHYPPLAAMVRTHRFRLEPGFAYAYAAADLLCAYGACLACVVPTPDSGYTRACLHGPLFPLEALAR